jgi:hypothetical protein
VCCCRLPEPLQTRKSMKPSSGYKTGVVVSIMKMGVSRSAIMSGR